MQLKFFTLFADKQTMNIAINTIPRTHKSKPHPELASLRRHFAFIDRSEIRMIAAGVKSKKLMSCAEATVSLASNFNLRFSIFKKYRGDHGMESQLCLTMKKGHEQGHTIRLNNIMAKKIKANHDIPSFRINKRADSEAVYDFFKVLLTGKKLDIEAFRERGIVVWRENEFDPLKI